jgi:hypothetical protein
MLPWLLTVGWLTGKEPKFPMIFPRCLWCFADRHFGCKRFPALLTPVERLLQT